MRLHAGRATHGRRGPLKKVEEQVCEGEKDQQRLSLALTPRSSEQEEVIRKHGIMEQSCWGCGSMVTKPVTQAATATMEPGQFWEGRRGPDQSANR